MPQHPNGDATPQLIPDLAPVFLADFALGLFQLDLKLRLLKVGAKFLAL